MLVFGLCFNFWWSAGLVDRLKPHCHPSPAIKNKMLIFGLRSTSDDRSMDSNPICHPSPVKKMKCLFLDYVSTSDDRPGWSIDSNPIRHPSPAKKMKCSFSDYVQLLMTWAVNGLKPRSPPLSSQRNEMLVFGLCSTSDDWPGWLMDSNPICHPSPAKKFKFSFFDYVQLLMIGWAGWWTQTPSATPLESEK